MPPFEQFPAVYDFQGGASTEKQRSRGVDELRGSSSSLDMGANSFNVDEFFGSSSLNIGGTTLVDKLRRFDGQLSPARHQYNPLERIGARWENNADNAGSSVKQLSCSFEPACLARHGTLDHEEKHQASTSSKMDPQSHSGRGGMVPNTASAECYAQVSVPYLQADCKLGITLKDLVVVLVTDLRAHDFGWLIGDRVLSVNGVPVCTSAEFADALCSAVQAYKSLSRPLVFDVLRSQTVQRERGWDMSSNSGIFAGQCCGHPFSPAVSAPPLVAPPMQPGMCQPPHIQPPAGSFPHMRPVEPLPSYVHPAASTSSPWYHSPNGMPSDQRSCDTHGSAMQVPSYRAPPLPPLPMVYPPPNYWDVAKYGADGMPLSERQNTSNSDPRKERWAC